MKGRLGRNDPCPCGSGRKYKRCCLDATTREQAVATPHEATRAGDEGEGLALLVETARGTMVRIIPSASPLSSGARKGYAAGEATHGAAALWVMPDFVFRPETTSVGSGRRDWVMASLWWVIARRSCRSKVAKRPRPIRLRSAGGSTKR